MSWIVKIGGHQVRKVSGWPAAFDRLCAEVETVGGDAEALWRVAEEREPLRHDADGYVFTIERT